MMHASFHRIAGVLLLASTAIAQPAPTASKTGVAAAKTRITQGIATAKMEKVAPNRGIFTVATERDSHAGLRLLDATGKEVAITRTPEGAITAEIDPQRGYLLTPPPPERQALPKDGVHFPARYVTFTPAGATNLGGLFLRPSVVPLTWNDQTRVYSTELFVGYEFADGREVKLPVPRTVTFFAEGANARIQADSVTVEKSGGSGYQRVVLSTGQIEGETHFTARVSAADELKSSVTVFREAGALKLSMPSTELPAFGVGSGVLAVTLLARDGAPFATPKPLEVQLTSRGLRASSPVVIEAGKSVANVDMRSVGYGPDQIMAQSGAFQATLPIELVFPTAPIIASILGGALGGATRFLRNKRRGGALLGRRVIEGMLVGLILVGAVWAGLVAVDVTTGVLGTPFGAFVLGALSGYLGCVVLDRVANKTFRGLKEA